MKEARYYDNSDIPSTDWDSLANDPCFAESSVEFEKSQERDRDFEQKIYEMYRQIVPESEDNYGFEFKDAIMCIIKSNNDNLGYYKDKYTELSAKTSEQSSKISQLQVYIDELEDEKKDCKSRIDYLLSFISDCLDYQPDLTHSERNGINKLIINRIRLFSVDREF